MAEYSWDDMVAEAEAPEELLPDGTYTVVVEEATYKESKKGDPQLVMRYKVEGGPWHGRSIWEHHTAVANSDFPRKIFVNVVQTLLGPNVKFDLNGNPQEIGAMFIGKRAIMNTKIKADEGYDPAPKMNGFLKPVETAPEAPTAAPAPAGNDVPPPQPLG